MRGRKVLKGFATQKVLGMFCYLLDSGNEEIGREKLMSMFWGDFPENQARYNLRYALWNIRKLFKETDNDLDPLITSRTTCMLNPSLDLNIDSHNFESALQTEPGSGRIPALEKSIELYRGPFLDGFTLRNLPDWEEWLYHRREAMHQGFLNSAIELGNHYLQNDLPVKAVTIFMRALATTPDFDPAHEGLIRAYAEQGRSSAALRQYNVYVKLMKKEHNAPPSPEIAALTEELRSGAYVKSRNGSEQSESSQPVTEIKEVATPLVAEKAVEEAVNKVLIPEPQTAEPEIDSGFIGRVKELKVMQEVVEEVAEGNGQVLIISGEMGIGKTRLFQEFLKIVPDSFIIGTGEAQEISSSRPLEGLMQVLESLENSARLSPQRRIELDSLLNKQRRIEEESESYSEVQFLEAIRRWILSLVREAPALIAIDDLHWASEALLSVFAGLSQDAKRLPLLVVGIFRTFELQSEDVIASSLISIARTGKLRKIELKSLSHEDTIQLIAGRASKSSESIGETNMERLGKFSCGIPLFAVELANFIQEGRLDLLDSPILEAKPDFNPLTEQNIIPPLLLKIANLRLSQLSKLHVKILKVTALLLGSFSLSLINEIVAEDSELLEDALVDLEHRNIIHHIEKGEDIHFSFNHLLIKLAIAKTISSLEMRRLYTQIVPAIDKVKEETSSDAMAYYLYNTGERKAAIPFLLTSSRLWFGFGDKNSGLRFSKVAYKIAMDRFEEEPELMVRVVLEHGENLLLHGMIKAAVEVYSEAVDKLETPGTDQERTSLLTRRDELKALLKRKPNKKKVNLAPLALVTTKRALANVRLLAGDPEAVMKLLVDAEAILEKLPDTPEAIRETGMLFQVKAKAHLKTEELNKAVRLLENSLDLLKDHGVAHELAETYRLLGHVKRRQGKFDESEQALIKCSELSKVEDEPGINVLYNHECGMLAYEQDMLVDAEIYLLKALKQSRGVTTLMLHLPSIIRDYASILSARGNSDQAQRFRKAAETLKSDLEEDSSAVDLNEMFDRLGIGVD